MTEWGWVSFAYAVAYGSIALYAGSIAIRIRRNKQIIERSE